jgi:hypothetical protein
MKGKIENKFKVYKKKNRGENQTIKNKRIKT